jgi:WD40 repeat protein
MRRTTLFLALCLLTGCQNTRETDVPDKRTPEKVHERNPGGITRDLVCAAVSPDGKRVVTGDSDGYVTLWDAGVEQPAVAPGSEFEKGLWSTRIVERDHGNQNGPLAVAFDDSGKLVFAVNRDGLVLALDRATGNKLRSFMVAEHQKDESSGKAHADLSVALFLPGGKRLVTSHNLSLKVWDLATGNCDKVIPLGERHSSADLIAAHPSGGRVLMRQRGCDNQKNRNYEEVVEWDLSTGRATPLVGGDRTERFRQGGYLAHGQKLWCIDEDGLATWDLTSRKKTKQPGLANDPVWIAFSPDGRRLAAVESGARHRRTTLHDPASGRAVEQKAQRELPAGHLQFFPDGRRLLVFGGRENAPERSDCDNRVLLVWDCEKERLLTLAAPVGEREARDKK